MPALTPTYSLSVRAGLHKPTLELMQPVHQPPLLPRLRLMLRTPRPGLVALIPTQLHHPPTATRA